MDATATCASSRWRDSSATSGSGPSPPARPRSCARSSRSACWAEALSMSPTLPPIPTHVIGSHGFPGWFWTALDKIKAGEYGQTDARETFDDATQLAIRDQERAGVDVVCDGEMRRFFFVQTFYGRMDGLDVIEPLRKTGLYAYDSTPRYRPRQRIEVPKGLGVVDGFRYLKTQTEKPLKATCPGPVTLSIHVQLRPGDPYGGDRLALCWDLVPAVNAELRALVEAGAVVDVKSFYLETAEDVAERLVLCAKSIPVERLSAVPDCGFFPVPRWVAVEKLTRLVAGTRLARTRLGLA